MGKFVTFQVERLKKKDGKIDERKVTLRLTKQNVIRKREALRK